MRTVASACLTQTRSAPVLPSPHVVEARAAGLVVDAVPRRPLLRQPSSAPAPGLVRRLACGLRIRARAGVGGAAAAGGGPDRESAHWCFRTRDRRVLRGAGGVLRRR